MNKHDFFIEYRIRDPPIQPPLFGFSMPNEYSVKDIYAWNTSHADYLLHVTYDFSSPPTINFTTNFVTPKDPPKILM